MTAEKEKRPAKRQAGASARCTGAVHPWSWIFSVSFILTAAFIVINVLIGIVLNSMEEAREPARRESLPPDEAVPVLERI